MKIFISWLVTFAVAIGGLCLGHFAKYIDLNAKNTADERAVEISTALSEKDALEDKVAELEKEIADLENDVPEEPSDPVEPEEPSDPVEPEEPAEIVVVSEHGETTVTEYEKSLFIETYANGPTEDSFGYDVDKILITIKGVTVDYLSIAKSGTNSNVGWHFEYTDKVYGRECIVIMYSEDTFYREDIEKIEVTFTERSVLYTQYYNIKILEKYPESSDTWVPEDVVKIQLSSPSMYGTTIEIDENGNSKDLVLLRNTDVYYVEYILVDGSTFYTDISLDMSTVTDRTYGSTIEIVNVLPDVTTDAPDVLEVTKTETGYSILPLNEQYATTKTALVDSDDDLAGRVYEFDFSMDYTAWAGIDLVFGRDGQTEKVQLLCGYYGGNPTIRFKYNSATLVFDNGSAESLSIAYNSGDTIRIKIVVGENGRVEYYANESLLATSSDGRGTVSTFAIGDNNWNASFMPWSVTNLTRVNSYAN